MVLHFGPDFHLSSDQKDLQIKSRNKSCWMVFLFDVDFSLLIERIYKFAGTLCAAEWFFFLGLISMYFQIRRICRLRVALRVAEWFFILVLIFYCIFRSGFLDLESHEEQLNGFTFWCWFSGIFRSAGFTDLESWAFFILVLIFRLDQQHSQIYNHIDSSWMFFSFWSWFQVSSDHQIQGFRVALRAAEWFFILVLIFT